MNNQYPPSYSTQPASSQSYYPPPTSAGYYYQQQPQYPPMAGQAQPVYAQPMNSSQGMGMGTGVQNVPCARCGSVYPLPVGSTSWRCKQCQSMNGGGLGCIIL